MAIDETTARGLNSGAETDGLSRLFGASDLPDGLVERPELEPGPGRSRRPGRPRGTGRGGNTARLVISAVLLAAVAIAAAIWLPPIIGGSAFVGIAVLYLLRRWIFNWTGLLMIFAAIVMFIPIRRYAIPIPLPFQLEPYRLVIVIMLIAVILALLVDPRFTWRPVKFGWPIAIFLATMLISIAVNAGPLSVQGLGGTSVGALENILLMFSVFYLVRQLLRTERTVFILLTFLTWAGAIVGFFAVVEKITNFNIFLHFGQVLPLKLLAAEQTAFRAGGDRSYGSAQHPIALSVMLCMLIPLAIYLAKYAAWPRNEITRKIVYGIAIALMLGGVAAAISRTAVVVVGVMMLLTLLFRPRLGWIFVAITVPALLVGSLILPKVIGAMVGSFLDPSALIASQYTSPGWAGAGRLADLGPAFSQIAQTPFFGMGFGSRIVVGPDVNSFILDNQFLDTFMEAGIVGVFGLAVLMLAPPIMLIVFSIRARLAPRYSMLAFAIAVSMAGYVAALFFYDAFGFYQTFLLLCMEWAVGAWLLSEAPRLPPEATTVAGERIRRRALIRGQKDVVIAGSLPTGSDSAAPAAQRAAP